MIENMNTEMNVTVEKWLAPFDGEEGLLEIFVNDCAECFKMGVTVDEADPFQEGDSVNMEFFAYVNDVTVYESAEEYYDQSGSHRAAESIIPCGLFPAVPGDEAFVQSSHALINGSVKLAEEHFWENGEPFYAILMGCLGCTFTVFASPADFEELPEEGSILSGLFFIAGNIAKEED